MPSLLAKALLIAGILANLSTAQASSLDEIDRYLSELQRAAAFDGIVLILDAGVVSHAQVFGFSDYAQSRPISADTRFLLGDLSQIVTRAAIGRLIENDKLSLQSRLADVLPDFPDARRITILHLLEHTSGVVDTQGLTWLDTSNPMSLDAVIEGLSSEPLRFKPGVRTATSNGGYALLAKVIEVVSEQSYSEYLKSEFTDIGYPSLAHADSAETQENIAFRYMPGHKFGERTLAGTYYAEKLIGGSSLRANAADLAKFIRSAYAGDLLSESLSSTLFPSPTNGVLKLSSGRNEVLAHVALDLNSEQTIIVLSSNAAQPANLFDNVMALYEGENIVSRPISLATKRVPPTELETFVGRYKSRNAEIRIRLDKDKEVPLFVQGRIETTFSLTTQGEYYLPYYDWLCRFSAYNTEFECRERSGINSAPLLFERM
jgi:CubicO group peptidase (beta-lactamase class C family)